MSGKKKEIVFLKGKRVFLRPILRKDIPLLLRWINDEEVNLYLAAYLPVMEANEEKWLESLEDRRQTDITLMICTVSGKPIGVMGLHRISWRDRIASTGAFIGEKEYWSKGYGTEAKMILLNYAFNTLNLLKICSGLIAYNKRSYYYQVKCGYREEGRRRRQFYKNGRYWDEILMAVFKKNWLPLWRTYRETHLK